MEALGRVLEDDLRRGLRRELLAEHRAADGQVGDPGLVEPEDDPPLRRRGRVVEVDDRARRPLDRLECSLDQLRPRLGEDGDRRVLGDQVVLDQVANEVEVGLRRRGEADLDLLDAEPDEQVEHRLLARRVHRLDERLVAVAEVGRAPDRRAVEHDVGPGAVGQVDGRVRAVFPVRHRHGVSSAKADSSRCAGSRTGMSSRSFPLPGKEEAERERGKE